MHVVGDDVSIISGAVLQSNAPQHDAVSDADIDAAKEEVRVRARLRIGLG